MAESLPALPGSKNPIPVKLTAGEESLAGYLHALAEPALITRADLQTPGPTIVAVNSALCVLTGYGAAELIGRSPRLFQGPRTSRTETARLRDACERGESFRGETINYRKDGSTYLLRWTVHPIPDEVGRTTHFFSLQQQADGVDSLGPDWLASDADARVALTHLSSHLVLIDRAIAVLERTKRSFRSTELRSLRERMLESKRALTAKFLGPPPA